LKVHGGGPGPYGDLEGYLEWPAELYADERKKANTSRTINIIYSQDERLRTKLSSVIDVVDIESAEQLVESLKKKVEKLKDDEWMYVSADTLFKRDQGTS